MKQPHYVSAGLRDIRRTYMAAVVLLIGGGFVLFALLVLTAGLIAGKFSAIAYGIVMATCGGIVSHWAAGRIANGG